MRMGTGSSSAVFCTRSMRSSLHPGNNVREDDTLPDQVPGCGIRGIEVYSTYHTQEQARCYREKAEEKDLLITCGSDFH